MAHFKERRNHGTRHEIRHKSEFKQILKEQRRRLTKVVFQVRKCHRIYTLQHTPNMQITLPLTSLKHVWNACHQQKTRQNADATSFTPERDN